MQPSEDPFSLMFEEVGRREPGWRLPKVLPLSQHGGAQFPGPCKDFLKIVFVNGLQVRDVESAGNGIL